MFVCVCRCVSLVEVWRASANTHSLTICNPVDASDHVAMQRTVKPTHVRYVCLYVCLLPLCCGHFPFVVVGCCFFFYSNQEILYSLQVNLVTFAGSIIYLLLSFYHGPFGSLLCLFYVVFVCLFFWYVEWSPANYFIIVSFFFSKYPLPLLLSSLFPPFLLFIHRYTADQIDKINNNDHYLLATLNAPTKNP